MNEVISVALHGEELTPVQLRKRFGFSYRTIKRWIRDGTLNESTIEAHVRRLAAHKMARASVIRPEPSDIIVDPEDAHILNESRYAWRFRRSKKDHTWYVCRQVPLADGSRPTEHLHQVILNAPGRTVDHVNGNGLDNRKANLRLATHSQNSANARLSARNTSGYKGVSRSGSKWRAQIRAGGRKAWLGLFATPEQAHAAYCKAASEAFGEFANFGVVRDPEENLVAEGGG